MTARIVLTLLVVLLGLSQYQLWFGTTSISELQRLTDEFDRQSAENERLASRNEELMQEVIALKTDPEAIEELLRSRFGYVKEGEIFVRLIPDRGTPD
ncbi:septum formation initiator family protein [Litorivicinus sp.]|jgi:cell division protein FtsB|nr:septum formation initiator family protein [Litorivicinus sp.]MDC1240352.1 septum formation initiator family protein [Litorivicinus sp.]MDC1467040.1 septum formation initiator family protein [Litorivicinus sp.]|tara:strand:- start:15231 stop:15524 length:294 start_codon:yes stop_codon:yes gene_type:complete